MADAYLGKPKSTASSVVSPPDQPNLITHPSPCPICKEPAERDRFKPSISGVSTSLYHCPEVHLWKTQWTEGE